MSYRDVAHHYEEYDDDATVYLEYQCPNPACNTESRLPEWERPDSCDLCGSALVKKYT